MYEVYKQQQAWRQRVPLYSCLSSLFLSLWKFLLNLFFTQTEELEDAYDETWIVSGQSEEQQRLIETHPPSQPIYVEGAFRVWLSRVCINYFVLRAEPRQRPQPHSPQDIDGK